MLEAINSIWRQALDEEDVRLCKSVQSGLQGTVLHGGRGAKERVREIAPDDSTDLCDLARRAKSVEPRHKRLLQRRWNCLSAALFAVLQEKPRYFLDEQWHAAG